METLSGMAADDMSWGGASFYEVQEKKYFSDFLSQCSSAVRRHHEHSNSLTDSIQLELACIQRINPLLSWHEAW